MTRAGGERQRAIQDRGLGHATLRCQYVAARHVSRAHAREVGGHALAGARLGNRLVVDVEAAHAYRPLAGQQRQRLTDTQGPGPQRPGDDGADPGHGERAVDVQERLAGQLSARRHARGDAVQSCGHLGDPGTGRRRAGHERVRAGQQRPGLLHGAPRVGEVGLGDGHDAGGDVEGAQDGGVLDALGHDPIVGRDHHQVQIDPGRPRDHRPDEALVARDVDERQPPPGGQGQRRVAERDGDAALALLREPVGVDAGERADQSGLAVIDVSGGAQRERGGGGGRGRVPRHRTERRRSRTFPALSRRRQRL